MAELEVWLRGPLTDTPVLAQPIAHALLQAREEVVTLLDGFPDDLLWSVRRGPRPPDFICST